MKEQAANNPFEPYELGISPAERKIVIAEILRELRGNKGYSQRELAELLGISPQTYNGWEKARNEPPVEYLVRLSFLYQVSLDVICGREIPKVPTKRNIAEDIANMRMQIAQAEQQLGEITDENQRRQVQDMLQGMWAMLNLLEQNNQNSKLREE